MKNPYKGLPRSIWALFAVRLVISIGNFVFPFLTLILTSKLGWRADRAGFFLTCMQIAALPGVFLGGKLSDAVGRKKVIVVCQTVAVLLFFASLAVGFSPALPFLIAGASVALSMTWPVLNALVADIAPPESRKSAYALLYWGNNIGFSLGPLAAGFLFHRAPGLMFLGNACVLSASIFIMTRFVPETRRPSQRGRRDPQSPEAAANEAKAGLESPYRGSLWSVIAERPAILMFAVLVAVMGFVYSQNGFSLPLFLNEALGARGSEVFGSAMTVNGLTVVFFTLVLSRITAGIPTLVIMAMASVLYGLGFGMLSFSSNFVFVMLSTVVWSWGEILSATNMNVYVASKTPESHRGRVNSLVTVVTNIGSLSAPLVAGSIIQGRGTRAIWPIAFVLAIVAAILMLGLSLFDRAQGPGKQGKGNYR